MKRFLSIFFAVSILIVLSFSKITVRIEPETLIVGQETTIFIESDPPIPYVNVDLDGGGFENPDYIFEGIPLEDGKATVKYFAPFFPGEYKIVFSYEEETYELTVNVVEETEVQNQTYLTIEELRDGVLYHTNKSDVWETLTTDVEIKEGYELMTLDKGYLKLRAEGDIVIELGPHSQMLIERLKRDDQGRIDFSFRVKKGKSINKIHAALAPGSKYIVTDGSVTAGVRGTVFAFERSEDKISIKTFEGTVFVQWENNVFPVSEGYGFDVSPGAEKPDIHEHNMNLEDYEQGVVPKEEEEEIKGEEKAPKAVEERAETTAAPAPGPSTNIGDTGIGVIKKGEKYYLMYSISPEIDFGPFGIGIGLNAYQEEPGGTLYFGIPAPNVPPSTNIVNGLAINMIKLDLGFFGFRYGKSPSYIKGIGFFMNRYFVPNARVLDAFIRHGSFKVSAHLPYEVVSWFEPFKYVQSSNVFFGSLSTKLFDGFDLEITGIYDTTSPTPKYFKYAGIVSLTKNIFGIRLGVEGDGFQTPDKKLAYGGMAGLLFQPAGVFQFMAGVAYAGENFIPELLGPGYELDKLSSPIIPSNSFGAVGRLQVDIPMLGSMSAKYTRFFDKDQTSTLVAKGMFSMPKFIMKGLEGLNVGFTYIQPNFDFKNLLTPQTSLEIYLFYKLVGNSGINYKMIYNYDKNDFDIMVSFETLLE